MEKSFEILYGPDPGHPLPYYFLKQKINGTTYYIELQYPSHLHTRGMYPSPMINRVWKDPIKIIDEFTIKGTHQDWDIAIIQPGTYAGVFIPSYNTGLEEKYPIVERGKAKWVYNLFTFTDHQIIPKKVNKYVYGSGKYMKEPERLKAKDHNWDWQGDLLIINTYGAKQEDYIRPYFLEYEQNGTLYYIDPFVYNHYNYWLFLHRGYNVFTGIKGNEVQLPNNRFSITQKDKYGKEQTYNFAVVRPQKYIGCLIVDRPVEYYKKDVVLEITQPMLLRNALFGQYTEIIDKANDKYIEEYYPLTLFSKFRKAPLLPFPTTTPTPSPTPTPYPTPELPSPSPTPELPTPTPYPTPSPTPELPSSSPTPVPPTPSPTPELPSPSPTPYPTPYPRPIHTPSPTPYSTPYPRPYHTPSPTPAPPTPLPTPNVIPRPVSITRHYQGNAFQLPLQTAPMAFNYSPTGSSQTSGEFSTPPPLTVYYPVIKKK